MVRIFNGQSFSNTRLNDGDRSLSECPAFCKFQTTNVLQILLETFSMIVNFEKPFVWQLFSAGPQIL